MSLDFKTGYESIPRPHGKDTEIPAMIALGKRSKFRSPSCLSPLSPVSVSGGTASFLCTSM